MPSRSLTTVLFDEVSTPDRHPVSQYLQQSAKYRLHRKPDEARPDPATTEFLQLENSQPLGEPMNRSVRPSRVCCRSCGCFRTSQSHRRRATSDHDLSRCAETTIARTCEKLIDHTHNFETTLTANRNTHHPTQCRHALAAATDNFTRVAVNIVDIRPTDSLLVRIAGFGWQWVSCSPGICFRLGAWSGRRNQDHQKLDQTV